MKKIKTIYAVLPAIVLATGFVSQASYAATPANRDNIRIQTSTPKKPGDSLFSYTVQWRIDGSLTYESTGLSFISGPDRPKPTSDVEAARKLVTALNDGMLKQYPNWRGALPQQPGGKPEMTVTNKAGFAFTNLTYRDYSNQKLTYDMLGKGFSEARVNIGLDMVLAADVEYLGGFTPKDLKRVAEGGTVEISIDGGTPVVIQTAGKSTEQIEKEIAGQLNSGTFSSKAIFPNTKDGDARNSKPFDGGEVHLKGLSAKSITIDITDHSLGILTKFQFPDDDKPVDVAGPIKLLFLTALIGSLLYFAYTVYRDRNKED